jgi:hypothetical protein
MRLLYLSGTQPHSPLDYAQEQEVMKDDIWDRVYRVDMKISGQEVHEDA